MANWSQSHFLQSLGWATLNSFWQMALLWCLYLGMNHFLKLSAHRKYQVSVAAITTGFVWFLFTFFYYYQSSPVTTLAFFNQGIPESNALLNTLLVSASVAYLALLIFPSYRLYRNWVFVQRIKKEGLQKADLNYRLFVQKVAAQLGIRKKVSVYLSELVKSPLTVGYLKPIILLPVAALNHLSTQQVEAILLHELSHIRRYDYLVNFMISIINTILYFNPFVKQFMKNIEQERENCCDELVLDFGYDKLGYASALLTLERLSAHQRLLAMGATGKNLLLTRIETIVGMEKKKGFKRNQLAGMLAALFCIVIFNSVLIIRERKEQAKNLFAFDAPGIPFTVYHSDNTPPADDIIPTGTVAKAEVKSIAPRETGTTITITTIDLSAPQTEIPVSAPQEPAFMHVGYDEIDGSLTEEQKQNVRTTLEATKKVVSQLQWQEIEKTIADAMTGQEKLRAQQEYLKALESEVDWKSMEQKMKAQYEKLDWNRINANVNQALTMIQLDSLEKTYTLMLAELEKAKLEASVKVKICLSPLPDQSVDELKQCTEELRQKIDMIKAYKTPKKVVRL